MVSLQKSWGLSMVLGCKVSMELGDMIGKTPHVAATGERRQAANLGGQQQQQLG
jgi:hypothetical protein